MPGRPVIQVAGDGPDLVMLHGWGMHRGVWGETASVLARRYRLHLVDLPGHGEAAGERLSSDLAELAAAVAQRVPPAAWIGWSMGGLVTLQALLDEGARIPRAVLVATNPSFVLRPHWPQAVDESVFLAFASQLGEDFTGTLNRFLVLETLGSDTARESLRELKRELYAGRMPDAHALAAGLSILRESDFSRCLGKLRTPTLWLAGGRDRLVPPGAMQAASEQAPGGRFHRIRGAGHAPFIGHREAFVEAVVSFLEEGM
jgi:pimeloyl-[acyl-carrier protein] methyl ester esterase